MKQRNLGKRIVSLVLLAVMLLSCVPGAAVAVGSATDIQAIQKPTGISIVEHYDDYVGESWLESLALPATVKVILANGATTDAMVTWDASKLDLRTTGYYSLPGSVMLPNGATNGQNLTVAITVQVRSAVNLLTNSSFETGYTGWTIASSLLKNGTPAAVGSYALQARTSSSASAAYGILYPTATVATELAAKVAAEGAGQYYIGAQVRDYVYDHATDDTKDEVQHTDALQASIRLGYKNDAADSFSYYGYSPDTALSDEYYRTAGGIFTLTGEEVAISPRLYLKSATKFKAQWILVDDFQFIPLKVALKAEPSGIAEIKSEIPSRFVAVDYNKYVGSDWKAALGLPEQVDVLTDNGDTIAVDVTWNYSNLDVTTCGKYTLTGTLDDSACPNPKGLTVQQNIYVRKVENLFSNPSFENGVNGWSYGNSYKANGTPAALGEVALRIRSSSSTVSSYNTLFVKDPAALAGKTAQAGAGQYYISAQVRDYLEEGETAHSDPLQVYIRVGCKLDAGASSSTLLGTTQEVTLSDQEYVTTGGVFDMTGEEVWLRPDLYLKSATKFTSQWFLVDDMQFLPLNVLIPLGEEPADIVEVTEEIPVRAVVQNYDKYVGADWEKSLGLPTSVEVLTAKGTKAIVNVTWDYSGLNLAKTGKYTLTGTLDSSAYSNPNDLSVTQVIYIREAKNLFTNPSFEGGLSGWSYGSTYETNGTPAAVGKFALWVRSSSSSMSSYNTLFPSKTYQTELAEKVAEEGAGQYYIGAQVLDAVKTDEITHTDALKSYIRVNYKTNPDATSSSLLGQTQEVTLSDKEYATLGGVFEMTGKEVWLRPDLYLKSASKFISQWVLVDDMQFIPLNVEVKTYEGAIEEVLTIIPDRKIIQNYPNYIDGYTTADLMFPGTVEVRSTAGEIIRVNVKWNYESLDLSKLGTYTLTGSLDDMRLSNSKGLTVDQVVHVVSYQNLLFNGGFEDADDYWNMSGHLTASGVASPRWEGDYSLQLKFGRMDNYRTDIYQQFSLQAFYSAKMADVGQTITATGAGRYFFGMGFRGGESADDYQISARLLYKNMEKGDTSTTTSTAKASLSDTKFNQLSGLVDIPGDVYWTRMDIYFHGSVDAMRNSTLFLDKAELVPLNVEVPNMTDIISCETPADIYVHEGTSIDGLKLPAKLEVVLKNAQRFDLGVTWDTSNFDPNMIGKQTITGSLNLDGLYENPKKFTPSLTITVREKGQALRQTIYISTSGSEDNDGLTPETPKQSVENMQSYLKQGYNVKLKRGDTWYLPKGSLTFQGIYGTEDAPLVVGAYGSGELPIIAFMLKIEDSAWTLVDAKRNIYAADVSSLGQKNGYSVHRCFVDDAPYCHRNRTNYVTLQEEEFCSYGGMVYVRPKAGEVPKNVEVTPYGTTGKRVIIRDATHLTFENLHIQGASTVATLIYIEAPTAYVKIRYCSITHCNYYILVMEASDERVNYRPEVSNCFIDAMYSEAEDDISGAGGRNAAEGGHASDWSVQITEGIVMRDGVQEAWIHHNHIRNMSHGFITFESLSADRSTNYKIRGIFDCVVEDNVLEAVNVRYARAFNLAGGGPNAAGIIMSRNNTVRRNRCYDMSTSSHLYGENILVYSNMFSYIHCQYREDGTRRGGKSAQPYAFDSIDPGTLSGAVIVNNTCYNASSFIALYEPDSLLKHDNLIANNLVVNWTSDAQAVYATAGAFYDTTADINYFMNNAVYSTENRLDHFVVDKDIFKADEVNSTKAGYSGNLSGDPKFVNADLSQMVWGARLEFSLSGESPFRYAGLSINDTVYQKLSAWERLKAEYTDINGVPYLAESPSIGAYSYSERIGGEVASVETLDDVFVRTGATFESLPLPETVGATNDQGIDVVLLIDWDGKNFDSSKGSTVTLTGTLRNGPHTELNVEGKTVSINVQLKDKLELKDIVTNVYNIAVRYNTSLEDVLAQLPKVLHVVTEYSFEEDLPVTWVCDNYDPTKVDTYIFECVLPESMLTNPDDFELQIEVSVLDEVFRGMELLVNPDFIDGTSSAPWTTGWGTGSFKITTDPEYLYPGEVASAIVTEKGKYGSLQQPITGQTKLMGDGKYLFRCYMRAYKWTEPIRSSYACLAVVTSEGTTYYRCRAQVDIGEEWVEFSAIMDVKNLENATKVVFHTSTGKTKDDSDKSFVISGCTFVYLGATDAEVEATLDSVGLTWDAIKGENGFDKNNVMSDLNLPKSFGEGSAVVWTSSDESAITKDGKVTMGRLPKKVILTATVTYNGIETIKKFTVTVPRDPSLPAYSASISGDQTVNVGDEFQVVISLNSANADAFNAYRFALSFSTGKLEYVGISDSAFKTELDGGKLIIYGIGSERPVTDTITVTFRAKKSGFTDVRLTQAQVDLDPNADLNALPKMAVTKGAADIDVQEVSGENGPSDRADDLVVIWIIICVAVAILIAGGIVVVIIIKRKKQTPQIEE